MSIIRFRREVRSPRSWQHCFLGRLSLGRVAPSPLSPRRPQDDTGILERAPDRARRYLQLIGDPLGGAPLRIELRGPVDIVRPERPAIPLGDPVAPDVPENGRPVDLERCGQLLHRDTLTVGIDQLGHLVWSEASLHWERGDERVGGVNRSLAGALPQYRPERRQAEYRTIYLGKRVAAGR